MNLYKNGFVVAEISADHFAYNAWPLADRADDSTAESLTNTADDNWFVKYNMQHIVPDLDFTRLYFDYCKSLNLDVKVLLFESPEDAIVIDDPVEICETLGFDCIGTVYYSYLQTEYQDFKSDLDEKHIFLNDYGLFDRLEDVISFIELRKSVIASGINLEDFWEELPVRISVVNLP